MQTQFLNEPPHDKTHRMTVRPAKTQINLGIRPVWSESSLCAQWVAKDTSFLHVDSEDWSDWGDAQADLSLRWAHMPFCWFWHEAAQICSFYFYFFPYCTDTGFFRNRYRLDDALIRRIKYMYYSLWGTSSFNRFHETSLQAAAALTRQHPGLMFFLFFFCVLLLFFSEFWFWW